MIHTENLRHNIRAISGMFPDGVLVCASVKANAYGHGSAEVSGICRKEGVSHLGVATPWEAKELRDAGDTGPIILYGPTSAEEIPVGIDAGLQFMVTHDSYMETLISRLEEREKKDWPVHLKVDTGMGRVGYPPEEAVAAARRIADSKVLKLAGLATHFPVSDSEDPDDMAFTEKQFGMMQEIRDALRKEGIDPGILHVSNSGGIALHPEMVVPGMMIRPGIALYGYGPTLPVENPQKPVMEFRTRITSIKKVKEGTTVSYGRTWKAGKDCLIATIPAGYADGYPRPVSNKAEVLIRGKLYPVAGTICMDQCMINLGSETGVQEGDTAVLFGPDLQGPDAERIAGLAGTISYEITCGISARVPREYVD